MIKKKSGMSCYFILFFSIFFIVLLNKNLFSQKVIENSEKPDSQNPNRVLNLKEVLRIKFQRRIRHPPT